MADQVYLTKEQIIARLAANRPACWIFWEIKNLKDTYDGGHGVSLKEDGVFKRPNKHSMDDAIENMIGSLMKLIGIDHADSDEDYRRYDLFDTLDITRARDADGNIKFIIS